MNRRKTGGCQHHEQVTTVNLTDIFLETGSSPEHIDVQVTETIRMCTKLLSPDLTLGRTF